MFVWFFHSTRTDFACNKHLIMDYIRSIKGYPIRGDIKEFGSSGKAADRDTWSRFIMAQKTKPMESIGDVLQFIEKWTQTTSLSL